MKQLFLLLALVSAAMHARAEGLKLGEPQYAGTGCPAGSASVALSPEESTLSVLFDQYVVEAGGNGKQFDRKNCNLAIPIKIPQGYSYSIIAVDYRGFVSVPRGGRAQLSVNYFLSNAPGTVRTTKSFQGPLQSDYVKNDRLGLEAIVWSPCGADTILRTNTAMLVQSNGMMDDAMATVDSIDVGTGIEYHLQWRRCN